MLAKYVHHVFLRENTDLDLRVDLYVVRFFVVHCFHHTYMDPPALKRMRGQTAQILRTPEIVFTNMYSQVYQTISSFLTRDEIAKFMQVSKSVKDNVLQFQCFSPVKVALLGLSNNHIHPCLMSNFGSNYVCFMSFERNSDGLSPVTRWQLNESQIGSLNQTRVLFDHGSQWFNRPYRVLHLPTGRDIVISCKVEVWWGKAILGSNRVWETTNGGISWYEKVNQVPFGSVQGFASVLLRDGSVLVTGGYNHDNRFESYRSQDGGTTWEALPGLPTHTGLNHHSMTVLDPQHSDGALAHKYGVVLLFGGFTRCGTPVSDVCISMDGGASWTLYGQLPLPRLNMYNTTMDGISHFYYGRRLPVVVATQNIVFLMGGKCAYKGLHMWGIVDLDDIWMSYDRGQTWVFVTSISLLLSQNKQARPMARPGIYKITDCMYKPSDYRHALYTMVQKHNKGFQLLKIQFK